MRPDELSEEVKRIARENGVEEALVWRLPIKVLDGWIEQKRRKP